VLTAGLQTSEAQRVLAARGIMAVSKILEIDLLRDLAATGPIGSVFAHDKIEGMVLVDKGRRLVLSNDNDFGVDSTAPPSLNIAPKRVPSQPGTTDRTELLFIDLPKQQN
jgi:hypothetical protein